MDVSFCRIEGTKQRIFSSIMDQVLFIRGVDKMVRLYMKEEFVSKQEKIIVKNHAGEDIFLAVGTWGRVGDSISLYAMNGSLLVKVKQVTLSLMPRFDLYVRDEKIGTITKHVAFSKTYFKISKLNWIISGDFEHARYQVRQHAKTIMEMEKNCFARGDFYTLTIPEPHHAPICVVVALIVDHYARKRKKDFVLVKKNKQAAIRLI